MSQFPSYEAHQNLGKILCSVTGFEIIYLKSKKSEIKQNLVK